MDIYQWKIKRLIKSLESAQGDGTSMISLIIPAKDQITRVNKMLIDEYGTAGNIKSRVNRNSVQSAIVSTQQKLKLYPKLPDNGLVVYCGTVITDDNKNKKINIDFEPFKPINTSLYLCDNRFHTEPLQELLVSDDKYGYIVIDGNGCLFGTLSGNTKNILHTFNVDLPKKHGRGGQSSARFGRIRLEKRHNYIVKVSELASQFFITSNTINVKGIVVAGCAELKSELTSAELLDQRLQSKIIKLVDIAYGGENGFHQAIELSADAIGNIRFIHEKDLIARYFKEITQDTGKYCFGFDDTFKALEMGAVETLIVFENLNVDRIVLKNDDVVYLTQEQQLEVDIKNKLQLVDWLAENYKQYGCELEFITDKTQEGSQFENGFGGFGGILRYRIDFQTLNPDEDFSEFDEDFL